MADEAKTDAKNVMARRITPKLLATWLKNEGIAPGSRDRAMILGVARYYQTITTTYGDSTRFKGNFAMRLPNGKEYRAPNAFLPRAAEDLLRDLIDAEMAYAAQESERNPNVRMPMMEGRPIVSVEFAIWISQEPAPDDKPSRLGYEWLVEPVIESKSRAGDPILELDKRIQLALGSGK